MRQVKVTKALPYFVSTFGCFPGDQCYWGCLPCSSSCCDRFGGRGVLLSLKGLPQGMERGTRGFTRQVTAVKRHFQNSCMMKHPQSCSGVCLTKLLSNILLWTFSFFRNLWQNQNRNYELIILVNPETICVCSVVYSNCIVGFFCCYF